ncbi:hypothetical protein FKG94_16645 [Exilibacterium tricleocarpae]|uniref:Uncharacterized protein n=1 Tax=Exilibacterium tricleocarpae TaxID=2591008 RepID=A0A545TAM0_9GAMM|nr:hypothetical protein FKG94_16645 [Exilibacterium tricleocarpae]
MEPVISNNGKHSPCSGQDKSASINPLPIRDLESALECAKKVIENDLKGTEFESYTRIYDEEAE